MNTVSEHLPKNNSGPNKSLKAFRKAAGFCLALSLGIAAYPSARDAAKSQFVRDKLANVHFQLDVPKFQPLPDLKTEWNRYNSPDEEFIYNEVSAGRAGDKKLPVLEMVTAYARPTANEPNRRPLAIQNPILIQPDRSGAQYLVGYSSLAIDTSRTLVYKPIDEFQLCASLNSNPRVRNRDIGSNNLTGGFAAKDVGSILYLQETIDAACQRLVTTSELNTNTLTAASNRGAA